MANQEIPDSTSRGVKYNKAMNGNTTVSLATVVAICSACLTGAWAVSAEVHNYRLQNITTRLGTQENRIMSLIENQSSIDSLQERRIDHNNQALEQMQLDVTEIKADVKTLLGEP